MQKILKNEKGSISLFVLLSALFFLVVVTSVGVSFKNKERSIDSQLEKIKLSYEKDVGNESQIYAEESVKRTVTFDPNGGTVTPTSKVVKLGETYGELPTPTRDGYTFKGWNGKNILVLPANYIDVNALKNMELKDMFLLKAGTYRFTFDEVNNATLWRLVLKLKKIDGSDLSSNEYKPFEWSYWNNSYNAWLDGNNGTKQKYIINILEDCYVYFSIGVGDTSNLTTVVAQLEEGSEATEYEPYFVTSSTKVTQNNNDRYVLTAIWEPNE